MMNSANYLLGQLDAATARSAVALDRLEDSPQSAVLGDARLDAHLAFPQEAQIGPALAGAYESGAP